MVSLVLAVIIALVQGQPSRRPPTVLLVSLDSKGGKDTLDFKTAFRLTTVEDGVTFDLDADGAPELTAWTAADSKLAFLAIDRNDNGVIDNGSELFGNHTLPNVNSGVRALAQIEPINGPTGWIDDDDPVYPKLLLWEDRNHNGTSEADELTKASALLVRIGLGTSIHDRKDGHGNRFFYQGWATLRTAPGKNKAKGPKEEYERQIRIYDVFFAR